MTNGRTWRRRGVAAVLAMGLTTTLVACGDDDDEGATEDATTTTAAAAAGDATEACEAHAALSTGVTRMFTSLPDVPEGQEPGPEVLQQAQAGYDENVADVLEPFEQTAPDELADDVETVVTALRGFREAPDPSKLESNEVEAAIQSIDGHYFEACEGGTEVTAVDYAFQGVETLEAGTARIKLNNTGEELHEFIVVRPKAGVTETFDELLELPEEESGEKIDFVGAAFAPPGESSYAVLDLEPGTYYAVCFIPVGMKSEEQEVDGPPHFTRGMRQEITVS